MEKIIYILLIVIVILNGIGDAYNHAGFKFKSKVFEEVRIGLFWVLLALLIDPKYSNWILISVAYYCIKFVFTDLSWNITARKLGVRINDKLIGLFYTGTTSGWYSKFMWHIKGHKFLYLFLIVLIFAYASFIILRDLQL